PVAHVVLSANVFVGALRAIAVAAAAAPRVLVRPSRRESAMAPLLVEALSQEAPTVQVEIVSAIAPEPGHLVDVYGRRESIDEVARALRPGVRVRAHGPGVGLALVDAETASREELDRAADRLSWDVIAFDQRGCLSPRWAIFRGSDEDAAQF